MKTVSWSVMLFLGFTAGAAAADPYTYDSQINCQKKYNVDGSWESVGALFPNASGNELRINFEGTEMQGVSTTGSDGEWKVEGRCPGYVMLKNDKPFKIRDFSFRVRTSEIGTSDGRIELSVKGSAQIVSNGQKDEFDKSWTVRQGDLNKAPFAAKAESQTVCSNDLKIQFDDLRAVAIRKQGEGDRVPTAVELIELAVRFDPC